jgi:hypothetical protein
MSSESLRLQCYGMDMNMSFYSPLPPSYGLLFYIFTILFFPLMAYLHFFTVSFFSFFGGKGGGAGLKMQSRIHTSRE